MNTAELLFVGFYGLLGLWLLADLGWHHFQNRRRPHPRSTDRRDLRASATWLQDPLEEMWEMPTRTPDHERRAA